LSALVLALGLVVFSFTVSPGRGSLNIFSAEIARADGGHGSGSQAATQTPTATRDREPDVTDTYAETEMSDTANMDGMADMDDMDDMGAEAEEGSHADKEGTAEATEDPQSSNAQGDMDMSDEHPNDSSSDADNHEDSTYEDPESNGPLEMDMNEEREDVGVDEHDGDDNNGADGHDDSGSDEEGSHTEYEGPSDLVRNITLGGFAGINGSVLLAAAILKKKNPKKDKGKGGANKAPNTNRTTSTPINLMAPETSSRSNAIRAGSTGGLTPDGVSGVSPDAAVAPVLPATTATDPISADAATSNGDDLA
jgi:hypothetical protein